MLHGSNEQRAQEVPVLERRLLDRRAAPPAADEVDEPFDVPVVSPCEIRRPPTCRIGVEQVDDVGLDRLLDLGGELVEPLLAPSANARQRARVGKALNDCGAEVAGAARDRNDPSIQSSGHVASHVANLATVARLIQRTHEGLVLRGSAGLALRRAKGDGHGLAARRDVARRRARLAP
jgi:hypothetical protein